MKYISNEVITIKSLYNLQLLFYCVAADPCHPKPCKNKGTCRAVGELDFRCDCPPGLTGKTCEIGKPTNASVFATIEHDAHAFIVGGKGGGGLVVSASYLNCFYQVVHDLLFAQMNNSYPLVIKPTRYAMVKQSYRGKVRFLSLKIKTGLLMYDL